MLIREFRAAIGAVLMVIGIVVLFLFGVFAWETQFYGIPFHYLNGNVRYYPVIPFWVFAGSLFLGVFLLTAGLALILLSHDERDSPEKVLA